MVKNIIFDVYGTLISTGTGSVEATRAIFKKYNLSDSAEEIYRKWKVFHKNHINELDEFVTEEKIFIKDLKKIFSLYGIKDDPKIEIRPMLESLYDRELFEDTEPAIKELSKKFNIAIGSTTDTKPLMCNIRNSYLNSISNIFTSENLKCYKPDKMFYSEILRKTNWNVEECVFVGDSLDDDVMGPNTVGMKAILIDRKERYNSYPDKVKKIRSLFEIENVLIE